MKRLFLILFAVASVTASAGLVSASCRRVVVHHDAVVVAPVLAATFIPVQVPVYSVTYSPSMADQSAVIAELKKEIEALKANQPQVLPQKAEPKHVAIMNANKCATCHSGAAPKGGLTLGKLADLTGDQKLAIIDRITRPAGDPKRMPQGGKVLSVEDQSEIILGFARK